MRSCASNPASPETDRCVGLTSAVSPGIVIPLVVLSLVLILVILWYRRSMANLRAGELKPVSGVRLTAQALHRLPSPPWRVVHEIGGALGGVDHVIIGPPGVIAITTVLADRPDVDRLTAASGTAGLVAEAAVQRGPVDELARPAGSGCSLSAQVFWGVPRPDHPAWDEAAHGCHLVEGQRLGEWIDALMAGHALAGQRLGDVPPPPPPSPLRPSQIDLTWQAIVMGIGRPDPLPQ
jgi:hypothetical protein